MMINRMNLFGWRFSFRLWPGKDKGAIDWDEKTAGIDVYCRANDLNGGLK